MRCMRPGNGPTSPCSRYCPVLGDHLPDVQPNGLFINQRSAILRQALAAGLPTIFDDRGAVEAGGFMSYGVNQAEGSRHAAAFVDKILKGAKPGDLPIEFST